MPVGLAQFIYEAISVLQFEGNLTLQEEDASGSLMIGQLFNLTGSANTEWDTMAAMVQEISENLDAGETSVQFGPPKNLSADELVDLLRVNRARSISSSLGMRMTGSPSNGGSNLDLGQNTPEKNSVSGTAAKRIRKSSPSPWMVQARSSRKRARARELIARRPGRRSRGREFPTPTPELNRDPTERGQWSESIHSTGADVA